MAAHLELSPWIASPRDPRPPVEGAVSADVATAGARFTGFSAALALRRAGVDVVAVEREFAGFGAKGRNAGRLTPTFGKDLPTLLVLLGEARAAELVRFAEEAIGAAEELIASTASTATTSRSGVL